MGESHVLFPLALDLRSRADAVTQAIGVRNETIQAQSTAMAEVKIAKEELVRKYEINYLDARKKYGKANVEKLFPKFNNNHTPAEKEDIDNTDDNA